MAETAASREQTDRGATLQVRWWAIRGEYFLCRLVIFVSERYFICIIHGAKGETVAFGLIPCTAYAYSPITQGDLRRDNTASDSVHWTKLTVTEFGFGAVLRGHDALWRYKLHQTNTAGHPT